MGSVAISTAFFGETCEIEVDNTAEMAGLEPGHQLYDQTAQDRVNQRGGSILSAGLVRKDVLEEHSMILQPSSGTRASGWAPSDEKSEVPSCKDSTSCPIHARLGGPRYEHHEANKPSRKTQRLEKTTTSEQLMDGWFASQAVQTPCCLAITPSGKSDIITTRSPASGQRQNTYSDCVCCHRLHNLFFSSFISLAARAFACGMLFISLQSYIHLSNPLPIIPGRSH